MYEQPRSPLEAKTIQEELNPTEVAMALEGVGLLVAEELRALRQRGGTADEAALHVQKIVYERLKESRLFPQ